MMIRTSSYAMVVLCAVCVQVAVPCVAHGQTNLTIDEAIALGVERAPRLAEARARAAAAAAAVLGRSALARPTVTAHSGLLRTNHVEEFGIPQADGTTRVIFPDIPVNYRLRAEVALPVYTAGRVAAHVASAQADREASDADLRAVRAEVELDIVTAYWTLVTARERVAVLERARDRADGAVADVRVRVDTGLLPPNELLSAQAQRARQRVLLIAAANDASLAEVQLARLVGAQPGERLTPVTPVTRPTVGVEVLREQAASVLTRQAIDARPDRLALSWRQRALRASADASFAATRPQVGVLAAVEPARPNSRFVPRVDRWNTGWDLGVNVTWTLWDGGRSRADRAVVVSQADALGARLDEFDALVQVEVRQRQLDLASATAALEASNEAVAASTEARRVLGERFAVGVATSTDVLDSDVAMLEAELERTRLQAALRVSEARLLRTLGGR